MTSPADDTDESTTPLPTPTREENDDMTEPVMDELLISGSTPTDAYQRMNGLLARVLLTVARRRQEQLPGLTETLQDQVLVTSGGTSRTMYGWFRSAAWRHEDRPVHELFVNACLDDHGAPQASSLNRIVSPAEHVLTTLCHEAVHVYAEANGIKDTSRDGRYHNRRFGFLALAIGLHPESDERIGCRTPGLSRSGLADYGDLVAELEQGLVLTREPLRPRTQVETGVTSDPAGVSDTEPPTSAPKYVFARCKCETGRSNVTIRVARGGWRPDAIQCRICGEFFQES
jgi:hypothetical protein